MPLCVLATGAKNETSDLALDEAKALAALVRSLGT